LALCTPGNFKCTENDLKKQSESHIISCKSYKASASSHEATRCRVLDQNHGEVKSQSWKILWKGGWANGSSTHMHSGSRLNMDDLMKEVDW